MRIILATRRKAPVKTASVLLHKYGQQGVTPPESKRSNFNLQTLCVSRPTRFGTRDKRE
jgi:hypothetical protein